MKKIYQILIVLLLSLISFFYTERVIDFIRDKDPIMKSIKKYDKENKIDAVNAVVEKNKITPGIAGKKVDYDKSFQKMKKYGTYNESLTVFEEIEPTISIDDYYDKYISEGSGVNNDVSLVFEVKNQDNIKGIINTLKNSNTVATFFIDGLWLENNQSLVSEMASLGHEIEVLNYDNSYQELYFSSSLNLVNSITNIKPKYCYARYDNKEVLELCEKLKLHTIIPTIMTGNYPYNDIVKKIHKGSIIGFSITSSVEIELPTIINYLKQKGYTINSLDTLLNEAGNIK